MDSILTIVTPAETHNMTVLATVKDELGITDTALDARLNRWITEASWFIRDYCGRTFAEEILSEQWRGVSLACGSPLILSRRPVSDITSVTVDGAALDTDEYEVHPDSGRLWRLSGDSRATWCAGKIVVAYTAGYALLDSLPYGIETACIQLVKHRYTNSTHDPNVVREEIPGGNHNGVSSEIQAYLDKHRDVSV